MPFIPPSNLENHIKELINEFKNAYIFHPIYDVLIRFNRIKTQLDIVYANYIYNIYLMKIEDDYFIFKFTIRDSDDISLKNNYFYIKIMMNIDKNFSINLIENIYLEMENKDKNKDKKIEKYTVMEPLEYYEYLSNEVLYY
jgi:hypothetical protein